MDVMKFLSITVDIDMNRYDVVYNEHINIIF